MRARGVAPVCVALTLALATAACGARLSDRERTVAIGATHRERTQTTADAGAAGAVPTGAALDAGATTTTAAATGPATGSGATGTGTGTGSGTSGAATGSGPAACTPGTATSTGVTPTELKIGNVSQITGLVPGFGQTSVNGIKSYFNYVNNTGGVCGRKLTLVQADDRFQSATNRAETEKLATQVLAFAGSLTVVDDGGAPILAQYGVADVSIGTTTPRIQSKYNFATNPTYPNDADGNGQVPAFRYLKDTYGVKSAAIFYQDVAVGVNQSKRYTIDFAKAGIPVIATYPVAPTATNFRAQATDMKLKNVDFVITIAEINAIVNLARAFSDVGWFPKVPDYGSQVYGQKIIKLGGAAAENTITTLTFAIPEQAGTNPAVATFNTWYARTAPGAEVDFFSIMGWVAGEMLVKALRNVGPDPTQAKVVAELSTFTNYSSPMVAPINPAGKVPSPCFQVVAVKGGKWQKLYPPEPGFHC